MEYYTVGLCVLESIIISPSPARPPHHHPHPRYLSLYYTVLVLLLQRHVELARFCDILSRPLYPRTHTRVRMPTRKFIYKYMDGIIVSGGVRIKFALNTLKWETDFSVHLT